MDKTLWLTFLGPPCTHWRGSGRDKMEEDEGGGREGRENQNPDNVGSDW